MADFTINDEQFQQVIAQHILESITPETRDKLIGEALSFLIRETPDPYNRKPTPSPLALAFRQEVTKIARDVVSNILGEDKIRKTVEQELEKTVREWVKSHHYDLPGIIGQALQSNLEISLTNN